MSFESILRGIVDRCSGALGAALMGTDGIPIEQVSSGSLPSGALAEDLGNAGVEFGRILDDVRKASDALSGGALRETIVILARFQLVFRALDSDTLLVVVLAPDGNLGKARYLIRSSLDALMREL
jgi:predicted regulator of Ras-like GTPase activity (Roadblock/LC7/MglB family)